MLKEQVYYFLRCIRSRRKRSCRRFYAINKELKKYSEKLAKRKQIIVANKMDVVKDEKLVKRSRRIS